MEKILLIGAAAVALTVTFAVFARRMRRRHKTVVPSAPPEQSRVQASLPGDRGQETVSAAIEHLSTERDEKSGVEGSPVDGEELVEPPTDEALMAPSGNDEVCKDDTAGLEEGEGKTVQSPESPESAIGGETQVDVEVPGENEAVSNLVTRDSLGATIASPADASTEIGAARLDLTTDTEEVKGVEALAGSVARPDAAAPAAPLDSSVEAETRETAPVRTAQAADSEREDSGEGLTRAQKTTRVPRQYRPVVRTAPKRDLPSVPEKERVQRERALALEVRLVFEPGGLCRVSLLPQRAADLPQELLVSSMEGEVELAALQEDWYEEVSLSDVGKLLRTGIEWEAALPEGRTVRWSLSGREIYVLAPHDCFSGFVSASRLVLGEQHVVLSALERGADVLRAIEISGSPEPEVLSAADGMPEGWIGFRRVIPHKPVTPSLAGDILDALCPLADTEIVLKGGIRIGRSTWLKEYPPMIQLRGHDDSRAEVLIDGQGAEKDESGAYTSPGWDLPGDHSIWCVSASKSYSIGVGLESWEPWDAYAWSWGESQAEPEFSRPAICGVLVRSPRNVARGRRPAVRSASNPILIGTGVGEIEICRTPPGVRTNVAIGFPSFDPVWAVPADALHSDKRVAKVLLVGSPRLPEQASFASGADSAPKTKHARRERTLRARAWCSVILDAGRKGLQPEPNTAEISAVWKQYRRTAKLVWRTLR